MRFRGTSLGLLVVLLWMTASPAFAIEEAISDLVLITEDVTVGNDLLAGGNSVLIKGTVEGDLVAAAFDTVAIDGTVEGDLLVLAPRVVINGEVLGSVRSLSGRLDVSGRVGTDIQAVASRVDVSGVVDGDLHGAFVSLVSTGRIAGRVVLRVVGAVIDGAVGEDVEGASRRLSLGSDARVAGDVSVRGRIEVAEGASVLGSVRSPGRWFPLRARSFEVLGLLVVLSLWLLAGPALARFASGWLSRHLRGGNPTRVVAWGGAAVVGVGAVVGVFWGLAAISSAEAAVTLGAVAIFLGLAGLVLLVAAAVVGMVPATVAIGLRIGSPSTLTSAHVRGVTVVSALVLLPAVGTWFLLLFLLFAVGSVVTRTLVGESPPIPGVEVA